MVPDTPSRGGDENNASAYQLPTNNPTALLSPELPLVGTPPASPIPEMPPLSPLSPLTPIPESHTPPVQESVPEAPIVGLAPKELAVGGDGMAVGLENYGRGKRAPQPRVPWNYRGPQWPPSPETKARQANTIDVIEFFMSHTEAMEFAFECAAESAMSTSVAGPTSFDEAMKRPPDEALKWKEAAMAEMETMMKMGVFKMVKLPPGRKAIGNRWVFRVKLNADGTVERYKARLVAKGYAQRPGFDFTETFSPTPKWATIRAILALGALEDLEIESIDISSAFLNGDLDEEVYMTQAEGFTEMDNTYALRLLKAIYGLKQAGRQWHLKLHSTLVEMGYERVRCEHSVWVYKSESGETRIIIPVFIDDMTIVSKSIPEKEKFVSELKTRFDLRELGPTNWLLGVEITRDRGARTLALSQRQYILDILERAHMSDCHPISTPLDPGIRLTVEDCPTTPQDEARMRDIPYLHILGAIAYLATATRPDIAYAVGALSRFSKNPGWTHWLALKHLLRYLKGTLDMKLTFAPSEDGPSELFQSYSDADHGGNVDNGRSTSGSVIKMGTGAISWMSRLQPFVTLSTTEAEYVSAVATGQEIIWLRNLFSELGYAPSSPSRLRVDNQSAISVARNPDHHGRVKHLDLRFYWLREVVSGGTIDIEYCPTAEMAADGMTKALGREKTVRMQEMLGLRGSSYAASRGSVESDASS